MKNRIAMLKVKIKSLAEEARIIRHAEMKNKGRTRELLYLHRVQDVRTEQRSSLLAYAFLRGVAYRACEPNPGTRPDWNRVQKLIGKFGTVVPKEVGRQNEMFILWREGAPVSEMRELPKYRSRKIVRALKIQDITINDDQSAVITPAEDGYAPFTAPKEFMAKHSPQVGGYFVWCQEGYASYSPAQAFEEGYTRI